MSDTPRAENSIYNLVCGAIFDPSKVLPRNFTTEEPLHEWQARAVAKLLRDKGAVTTEPVQAEPCPFPHVGRFFVVREGARSLICQWIDMAQLGRSHSVIAETTVEQRAYEIARALEAELNRQLNRPKADEDRPHAPNPGDLS